jgi:alanine racemase
LPGGGDLSSPHASDLKKTHFELLAADWMSKEALVFGDQSLDKDLTIESLAAKAGLITYEFMVRLSPRLQRRTVGL